MTRRKPKTVGYPTFSKPVIFSLCSLHFGRPAGAMRKGTRTVTTHQGLRLATGVVVENMGTTVLVMIPGQHDVLTLTGPAADVVNAVVAGQPVSKGLEPEVELLLSAGVLTSPMSRRNLLRAGAIGAGAGIAALSMPSVAAASSPPVSEGPVFIFSNANGEVNASNPLGNDWRLVLRDEPRFNNLVASTSNNAATLTFPSGPGGSIGLRNVAANQPRVFEPNAFTNPTPGGSDFNPGSGVTFRLTFNQTVNPGVEPVERTL